MDGLNSTLLGAAFAETQEDVGIAAAVSAVLHFFGGETNSMNERTDGGRFLVVVLVLPVRRTLSPFDHGRSLFFFSPTDLIIPIPKQKETRNKKLRA